MSTQYAKLMEILVNNHINMKNPEVVNSLNTRLNELCGLADREIKCTIYHYIDPHTKQQVHTSLFLELLKLKAYEQLYQIMQTGFIDTTYCDLDLLITIPGEIGKKIINQYDKNIESIIKFLSEKVKQQSRKKRLNNQSLGKMTSEHNTLVRRRKRIRA